MESKRAKVNKAKKHTHEHTTGLWWCAILFMLCFIPSSIYFLYNIAKDPLTPTIVANLWAKVQEQSMGFLSEKKTKKTW